ncbi:glycosyltransferase family 2 protein [Pelagibacterium lacus]|nr:glycosyltransferase family 2 protein [Pelagibacterium lacus]
MAIVVICVGASPEVVGAVQSIFDLGTPCEVIVVNSGGGDVRERLGTLGDRVKIIEHEAVLWVGAARNLGIEAASAAYIAFLAADCRVCPGWIDKRMARHRQGHAAVGSAVVGSGGWNPFAWASHFTLFDKRLPDIAARTATPYGASYDRRLFALYGTFRADLRIGEDTEFHQRLPRGEKPVWAPEVLTLHRSPGGPVSMLADQYCRGIRSGHYWPGRSKGRVARRLYYRLRELAGRIRRGGYRPGTRWRIIAHFPLIALNMAVFELGVRKGKTSADPLAACEAAARRAERAKRWDEAGAHWRAADELSPGHPTLSLNQARCLRMSGHLDAALAICDTVARAHPQLVAPIEERARLCESMGAWTEALAGWRQLTERNPRSGSAQLNLGEALVKANDWQGARVAYQAARLLLPDASTPLRGLAAVAGGLDDNETALELYDSLWNRFSDENALIAWIELLLKLGRQGEATTLVTQVEAAPSATSSKLAARVTLLRWHHDWEGIVALLDAHPDIVTRSRHLLGLQINSLCMLNRQADAHAVIAHRGVSRTVSKRLTLDVQLRFGDYAAARQTLSEKLEAGNIDDISTFHATPLIIGAYEQAGLDGARDVVASLARGSVNSPRGEILRLSLPYQKLRLDSLAWLEGGRSADRAEPEREVLDLLSQSRPRTFAPDAYDNLAMAGSTLARMRRAVPDFHPDPLYSLADALAVARHIVSAIEDARPLSLVRLGDGEGKFFPYPSHLQGFAEKDRIMVTQSWWNLAATGAVAGDELSGLISAAADASDILGIPDLSRIIRVASSGLNTPGSDVARNARGLFAALDYASGIGEGPAGRVAAAPMITSCHIHEALAFWALWPPLLRHMREVSLVTCHSDLPAALRARFGVETRILHLIPSESKYAALFGEDEPDEPHFPDVFRRIEEALASTPSGHVLLVAAGALGKVYCHRVRDAGGIAIDIGSVADYWCGYHTRGYDETLAYRGLPGLPALYDALADRDPGFARFWRSAA